MWLKDNQVLLSNAVRSIEIVRSSSSETTSTLDIRVSIVFDKFEIHVLIKVLFS